jgi:hypothetical protein
LRVEELFEGSGGKLAAQTYWNALNKLRAAWHEVFGEPLPTEGNNAMDAFRQALDVIKARLKSDAAGGKRLRDALDVGTGEDIAEVLLTWADMEGVTPAAAKLAMRAEARRLGAGRHELRALLRPVLDALFADSVTRRPRVGANRHWRRLFQYLRELEDETDWSPAGRGIHLMNAGGGGKVSPRQRDPGKLAVRIDPSYL